MTVYWHNWSAGNFVHRFVRRTLDKITDGKIQVPRHHQNNGLEHFEWKLKLDAFIGLQGEGPISFYQFCGFSGQDEAGDNGLRQPRGD